MGFLLNIVNWFFMLGCVKQNYYHIANVLYSKQYKFILHFNFFNSILTNSWVVLFQILILTDVLLFKIWKLWIIQKTIGIVLQNNNQYIFWLNYSHTGYNSITLFCFRMILSCQPSVSVTKFFSSKKKSISDLINTIRIHFWIVKNVTRWCTTVEKNVKLITTLELSSFEFWKNFYFYFLKPLFEKKIVLRESNLRTVIFIICCIYNTYFKMHSFSL